MKELDEIKYQKIKTKLKKENDYFSREELEKYGINPGEIQAKLM